MNNTEALRLADAIDPMTRKQAPDHLTVGVAAAALRALAQQPAASAETTAEWRKLALQFDAQRMSAMWHLSAMLQDPTGHAAAAREFMAAAPQPAPARVPLIAARLSEELRDRMCSDCKPSHTGASCCMSGARSALEDAKAAGITPAQGEPK